MFPSLAPRSQLLCGPLPPTMQGEGTTRRGRPLHGEAEEAALTNFW
jgi:hypothetical protein